MSATMQPRMPPQGNVVPFPQQGMPPQPQMVPNPAFQQWMQRAQQVQAIQAQNAQKQAQFQAAVDLIRKDGIHGFKLDIEADSTIAPDEQAEKQSRIEFTQQLVPFMEQVIPSCQGNPPMAALAKEVLLFTVRGFRVARTLEEQIEKTMDAIAGQPPPPPKGATGKAGATQNPQLEAAKLQADAQETQAKVGADVHDTQIKAQTDMAAIAQKQQQAQLQAMVAAQKLQAEDQRSQATMAMQAAELAQRERLEAARVTALQSRAAKGLV